MRHSFWFSFLHGRSASAGETHHHYGIPFLNAVPFNTQAIQDRFHILRCCCYMQSKDVFTLKLGSQWTSFLSASDPASVHLDICAWMFLRSGQVSPVAVRVSWSQGMASALWLHRGSEQQKCPSGQCQEVWVRVFQQLKARMLGTVCPQTVSSQDPGKGELKDLGQNK